jgi:hypothetical protein
MAAPDQPQMLRRSAADATDAAGRWTLKFDQPQMPTDVSRPQMAAPDQPQMLRRSAADATDAAGRWMLNLISRGCH